uniref:KID domain-containing protein n=1 Tax=Denticeps clupeoides TaxID=299321 RepID=A0AAY4ANG1_9TELE
MTMETVVATQQEGSASDSLTDGESSQIQSNSNSPTAGLTQVVSGSVDAGMVAVGVIQAQPASVIQSPQALADGDSESLSDSQKRREILSRRLSYRKIFNELSSDTPAVPKIEAEEKDEEASTSSVAEVTVQPSIYQTSSGQYITISQSGAIQLAGSVGDNLSGIHSLTLPSSGAPQPGATILQYAPQSGDPTQQFLLPGGPVVVQGKTSVSHSILHLSRIQTFFKMNSCNVLFIHPRRVMQ